MRVASRCLSGRSGRSRAGFTLVEVLVVLAIAALLLTLALPRYFSQLEATRETVLRENLRLTRLVIGQFYGDQGRYPEALAELVDKRYLSALPLDPITRSAESWQIEPVPEGYKGQVYNLRSGAPGAGRDGTPYSEW